MFLGEAHASTVAPGTSHQSHHVHRHAVASHITATTDSHHPCTRAKMADDASTIDIWESASAQSERSGGTWVTISESSRSLTPPQLRLRLSSPTGNSSELTLVDIPPPEVIISPAAHRGIVSTNMVSSSSSAQPGNQCRLVPNKVALSTEQRRLFHLHPPPPLAPRRPARGLLQGPTPAGRRLRPARPAAHQPGGRGRCCSGPACGVWRAEGYSENPRAGLEGPGPV
jgi:hypothetical protein